MLNIGFAAMPLNVLYIMLALACMLLLGFLLGKYYRQDINRWIYTVVFAGFIVGRLVFVGQYSSDYLANPWSIVDIRDAGFSFIGTLLGMLVCAVLVIWRKPLIRKPLLFVLALGLMVWSATGGVAMLSPQAQAKTAFSDVKLLNLQGQSVALSDYFADDKSAFVVVNFWATWCPPCRAEMPMLAEQQTLRKNIQLLFVNYGETTEQITAFLAQEKLAISHVLMDTAHAAAHSLNVQAYPTTIIFDRHGRLLARHTGMLSQASFAHLINDAKAAQRP